MTQEFRVRSADDLNRLLSGGAPRARRVLLMLEKLSADEQIRWERQINQLLRACGCASGALALVLAVLACAAVLVIRPTLAFERPVSVGLAVLGIAALAMGVGKMLGLWAARRRLVVRVRALRERLTVGS